MTCPQCQTANPDGSHFCESCGARLALVCLACGKEVSLTARFCRWCGSELVPAASGHAPGSTPVTGPQPALLLPLALPVAPTPAPTTAGQPASFVNGRYTVKRFLGEGGRKKVYAAYDTLLDRDVAFSLIKTEGLDATGMARVQREAQAMGRLGNHPHIVSIYDIGEELSQLFIVSQLMDGGDVEGLLQESEGHRLALDHAVRLADQVCQALEHAHRHGIIHRDLKPGNVWLTAEGTAKLGDFGLAVALDRSRLSKLGTMVGTPSYMPPEQALESEVDARADLYSFGAMLYEMVVGRPPFQGSDDFDLISQHVNAPPTPPSQLRTEIPADLERLILQLLQKDKKSRPSSATEVRLALRALDLTAMRSAVPAEDLAPPEEASPPPAGPFVGREQELERLQAAFDQAAAGHGAVVAVVGEPGIGKSTLCRQLGRYVEAHGGSVLAGQCYEDASSTRPYGPFSEALGAFIARLPAAEAGRLLVGNAVLASLTPEVAERLGAAPSAGPTDGDAWRPAEAAMAYLQDVAAVQPLLLVLEDLHWADRASLDLLAHLARYVGRSRILVVATYREDDLARDHPLAALRRAESFQRIAMHGLNMAETREFVRGLVGHRVGRNIEHTAYRQTEGNPLFLQHLIRHLADVGVIVQDSASGRWRLSGSLAPAQAVPKGLHDLIDHRLARLSAQSKQTLAAAAILSDGFDLTAMQRMVDMGEEALLPFIEEAVRAGVLTEAPSAVGVQYRFVHTFFRAALIQELHEPQRRMLHQQAAQLLEARYAGQLDEHASELAEHFAQSSEAPHQVKAVAYGRQSVVRALAAGRYTDAVRLLEIILPIQEQCAPDDPGTRCDLLLALGQAQMGAGMSRRAATEIVQRALSLARQMQDKQRIAQACRLALDHWQQFGMMPFAANSELVEWTEAALAFSGDGASERVRAGLAQAQRLAAAGQWAESGEHIVQALRLAEQLDDPETLAQASWQALVAEHAALEPAERPRLAQRAMSLHEYAMTAATRANLLWASGTLLLAGGDRLEAERHWSQLTNLAEHSAEPQAETLALAQEQVTAFLAGDLGGAVEAGNRLIEHSADVDYDLEGRQLALLFGLRPLLLLGREKEALDAIDRLVGLKGRDSVLGLTPLQALTLAHAGRRAEAQTLLDQFLRADQFAGEGSVIPASLLTVLLETAVLLDDPDAARLLAPRLSETAVPFSSGAGFICIARCLGVAAALLDDREAARAYYDRAMQEAARLDFRAELALTQLELAGLLLKQPPRDGGGAGSGAWPEALEYLDHAIEEFRILDMQPALRRALRHKELLKA